MKKIINTLCIGILSVGIFGGCNNKSLTEISKLESEISITKEKLIKSNQKINKLNSEIDKAYETIDELENEVEIKHISLDLKEGTRECIDDEELQWLKIKDWDKITIRNSVTNENVEINSEDLPSGFTLYSSLESLITYDNIGYTSKDSPQKTELYIYEFLKDNDKYKLSILWDELGQFLDGRPESSIYKSSNLEILGDSFAPPTEYQYTENVLNKIYNCGMLVNNTDNYIINPIKSKEISKWIVENISMGVLEQVNEVPNINFEREDEATAYWHGERVHINLYSYGNTQYIEIIDNGDSVIYKESAPYSMGSLLN